MFDFLTYNHAAGYAYQTDVADTSPMTGVKYDDAYFDKVCSYKGTDIARAVNNGRLALLLRHTHENSHVFDFGAGSCEFMACAEDYGFDTAGFDVMRNTVMLLQASDKYRELSADYNPANITAWDVIEHLRNPCEFLSQIPRGSRLFVSLPIFERLTCIKTSKHYRPGEHFWYFTEIGFRQYMRAAGFSLLEISDHEVKAGREGIGAFAFIRD